MIEILDELLIDEFESIVCSPESPVKPPVPRWTWLDCAHQGTLRTWDSTIRPCEVSTPQCPLLPAEQRNPFITLYISTLI